MESSGNTNLEWSVAERALPGEKLSGDAHLVVETPTGWLLAVVDGLGHGPDAATAAKIFIETLERNAGRPPVDLINLCHKALKTTRGSVGALVTVNRHRNLLSWLGVGNVEGVLVHTASEKKAADYITTRGGIVGYRLPELQPSFLQLLDGDTLILATDGIDAGFSKAVLPGHLPGLLAQSLLDRYALPNDDALVLVARWRLSTEQQGG